MKQARRIVAYFLIFCLMIPTIFGINIKAIEDSDLKGAMADFVFIIDSTGSMGSYINSVKRNLTAFVNEIHNKGIDLRIAVIDYKDIYSDGANSTKIHAVSGEHWYTDVNTVVSEFNSISARGGGDTPETPAEAMHYTLDDAIWGWREDASKYIFLLTDANYKDVDTVEDYISQYREKSIHVSVVSKESLKNTYEHLFSLTDGIFINISSNDYYMVMLEISKWMIQSMKDKDGDGIPDSWETEGVDFNGDGTIDLDLPAMGANPEAPDVFVEIDWMYKPAVKSRFLFWETVKEEEINLKPSEDALRIVYEQFRNHGINLHIDAGSDSIDFVTGRRWGNNSGGNTLEYQNEFPLGNNNNSYANWNSAAIANFNRNRWKVFRYCMFITRFNGSDAGYTSGIAENIPGQFFIVCNVGKDNTKIAGTFMHELGHTLGLKHGGGDHVQYKPNYLSVMNYLFQFSGLVGTNSINYSEYELPALYEQGLFEKNGIDPDRQTDGTGLGTKIGSRIINSISGVEVDFDGDGTISDDAIFNIDLNDDKEFTELTASVNDWARLSYKGSLIGARGDEIDLETVTTLIPDPDEDSPIRPSDEISLQEAIEKGIADNPEVNTEKETSRCPLCGKIHSGFIGALIGFIHHMIYNLLHLFNR